MYAVIRAGGKQYRVQENDTVILEKMDGEVGDAVTLGEVLFLGGPSPRIGSPTVDGVKVTATILKQGKSKKLHAVTYVKVKNTQRHYGHRQQQTHVRIEKIEA